MTNNTNSTIDFNGASRETRITFFAVFIVVGFLMVAVNLATILTFVVNSHLRRRSVYCLIHLAVADMLFGVISVIYYSLDNVKYLGLAYHNRILQIFVDVLAEIILFTSLLSLVLVSLERVYATFFPFRHRTTRLRKYIVVFTITWLLPLPLVITLHILPVFNVKIIVIFDVITIILATFLVSLIIICTSYTAIFVKVKIQAKRLQPNQQQTVAIQIRQKREQHLAITLFIVTVLSLITWLPYIIVLTSGLHEWFVISYTVNRLVTFVRHTNSVINPIVYVFRMRDFRRALSQLMLKCSRDRQRAHPIGHHGNQVVEHQPAEIELHVM
jgi:hypothetical protein